MELSFKGLPQLLKRFPDDASARQYFEQQKWGGTPVCPFCGCDKWYKLNDGKTYKCGNKECHKKYTATVNTIFHGSHIPLNIWFAAMYLVSSHKKGISSHQLAKDLAITQKSAWYLLHRIREMVADRNPEPLRGIVEMDETYMARKYHAENKPKEFDFTPSWPNIKDKGCVFGMKERGGKVIVKVFPHNKGEDIKKAIKKHVDKRSWIYTDDSFLYRRGLDEYKRESVTHSKREYVRGDVSTNQIENFWGIMKRGIYGIYHQVSYKHLERYCHEFSFRFNNRHIMDNERFVLTLRDVGGKMSYAELIANGKEEINEADRWEEDNHTPAQKQTPRNGKG